MPNRSQKQHNSNVKREYLFAFLSTSFGFTAISIYNCDTSNFVGHLGGVQRRTKSQVDLIVRVRQAHVTIDLINSISLVFSSNP
jgi:hypothetical protein